MLKNALGVQLCDLVRDAVIGTDDQHRVTYWNPAATGLLGWSAEEAAGHQALELLRVTFTRAMLHDVLAELERAGGWQGESVCFAKDGRGLVCDASVTRLSSPLTSTIRHVVVIRDVTERVRLLEASRRLTEQLTHSEARLREERERFKGVIDSAMDAIVSVDEQQRIVLFNPAAERMFGVTADAMIGQSHDRLIPASARSEHRDDVERFAEHGVTRRMMGGSKPLVMGLRANGQEFPAEISISRTGPPGHQLLTAIIRDVTAREEAARKLAGALAFSEKLLAAAPVGCLTYRLTGACVTCNAEAARLLGTTAEELQKSTFRTLPSWKESGLLSVVERAIATRQTQSADLLIHTAFGKRIWALVRATIFRAADEDLVLLVLGDLTELKRTEDELRVLTRAIEQSPSSVVITDREGQIEYVNPAFLAVSGYSRAEVVGQNPRLLKSGQTPAEVYRDLWTSVAAGRTWRGELHNKRKNGEPFWERAMISPVTNDQAEITHFVAVKEDITAQKEAVQAAHNAEERFERAQKMEAIGRLAGGIAHDFNNVLTAILGYSEFVLAEVDQLPSVKSDVEEIKNAGQRAALLARQLLAFSRKQRPQSEVLDLNQIVADLTRMIGRLIGEDIRLAVVPAEPLGRVRLDPSQIEQVVMNLVVNARDAMPQGGQLTIATEDISLDDAFVAGHVGATVGPHVVLRVTDSGTGMPPDVIARVFEPFFTTKPPGKGTGLGLSTVYDITKQSGGFIDIQSTPGAGTTVSVYLPRVEMPVTPAALRSSTHVSASGTETVLIVEDEESLRALVQRTLQTQGYHVFSASDGDQALAVEGRVPGPIHLLVSDVVMPGLSGPDLAQRLVRRRPDMKVLYVSGFTHHLSIASGVMSHRTDFLQKPFTPEALAAKVRHMLDHVRDAERRAVTG